LETCLAQSEAHRTAYREVEAFWQGLSQIKPHAAPQLKAARAYLRKARQSRRAFSRKHMAGILSIALIAGLSPFWQPWFNTDIYRTAKGESAGIELSDGSHIDLNTDTELADNPFALAIGKASGRKAEQTSYVLCHQPKSFDWRLRKAKAHPLKSLPDSLFVQACDRLNQIIQLG
jgi:hypothetical protein